MLSWKIGFFGIDTGGTFTDIVSVDTLSKRVQNSAPLQNTCSRAAASPARS
jgi:N-methylhydantoinase A/oxoprolinase/acetone carboxylase beta subunit